MIWIRPLSSVAALQLGVRMKYNITNLRVIRNSLFWVWNNSRKKCVYTHIYLLLDNSTHQELMLGIHEYLQSCSLFQVSHYQFFTVDVVVCKQGCWFPLNHEDIIIAILIPKLRVSLYTIQMSLQTQHSWHHTSLFWGRLFSDELNLSMVQSDKKHTQLLNLKSSRSSPGTRCVEISVHFLRDCTKSLSH